ncbi:MAG: 1-deoxy-D-xylulose-5-phosphate reductoisomerase [Gammaproteobacteria bacterium]|nr:1-deoxy-D-xylulose-5-phosphate reductoisomerase [Gammaproteobacteria bacterium]
MIGVTILGATGSIGASTLDVISRRPDRYRVAALTANSDVDRLFEQCLRHRPELAVMADAAAAERLERKLVEAGCATQVAAGMEGLCRAAGLPGADYVMAAIVGAAGLLPTLTAVRAGKRVLLANKEALVMAGALFMEEVRARGAVLLPIDSEHNAVYQCMPGDYSRGLARVGVRRILLTSSGGPFRLQPRSLHEVRPEQACAHPNWVMGRKISVDSATMMNKGLEVIEAKWLFDADPTMIEVVVHPQSVIHSLVEYVDGSMLAQLASPDMRIPIAHALAWPERMESGAERLNLFDVARLDFEAPDLGRFPCLRIAFDAARAGGTAPAVMNAANEVAVHAFLERRLRFTDIPAVVEAALAAVPAHEAATLDAILAADRAGRACAAEWIHDSALGVMA